LTSTRAPLLARSAGLTGAATLTSRILGLLRDQVLAAIFGASNDMDAFIVAFRIPNLVRDLFAEGAMSAAFVPTFTRRLTLHGKDDAWRLGNNLLNALLIVTAALVVAGIVFARPLVTAYAVDFSRVPGKLELTILLTRLMLPFLTMVAVAAAVMGMLNSLHHYFVPALAPAMFNIATLVCAFALVPLMPSFGLPPIMAIAIAALLGGALQVLVQWPALWREGFRYRLVLDPRDPGLRQVLVLMGPGTIGLAATQVNLFVNTLLATSQGTGAVSWLSYAFRLMYLPIGLFGVSIATAALPAVSRYAAVGDEGGVRRTAAEAVAMMMVLNIPATLGLVTLADPIVRLLFERGHFTPSDTASTAAALRLYAVGLVGYATARIVSPVFYAIRQSRVPVIVSLCTIALNIAANFWLVRVMGFRGLALGTSLAMLVNGIALLLLLRHRLQGLEDRLLAITFGKVLVAALVMAAVSSGTLRLVAAALPAAGTLAQAIRLFAAIGAGLVALAAAARLLHIRQFDDAVATAKARLM
jgi:putative peptidoglycan lipid II flippase